MTTREFYLLKTWIEATIDMEIEKAFGRDPLYESIRQDEAREELFKTLTVE